MHTCEFCMWIAKFQEYNKITLGSLHNGKHKLLTVFFFLCRFWAFPSNYLATHNSCSWADAIILTCLIIYNIISFGKKAYLKYFEKE